jgi:hypothetical protein
MDLWGPAQTESVAGHLYYISFTNDYSQETKVCFLKLNSEALSALKDYEMELRRQTPGAKIKKLHSDRGGEYLSTEFDRYLKDQGIKHQLTIHHSPQQNSVAERLNHTLVEHARAMLLGRDMPKFLWAEALNYATWLKNCLPSHSTPGKTPYELVNKSKPNLALAHEFPVYVHVITGGKLEARAEEATFVRVDQESKGYCIWWAGKQKVSIERNVTFPPMGPITVRLIDNPDIGELGIIDVPAAPTVPGTPQSNVQPVKHPPPLMPTTSLRSPTPLPPPAAPRITRVRPATGYYHALHEGKGATSASIEEIGEENQTHWAAAAAKVKPTLKEALNGPDGAEWQTAIDYEIGQLEKLGIWRIVDPPPHANIILSHFVLATKRGADGEKLKFRAHLVANCQRTLAAYPPVTGQGHLNGCGSAKAG